MADAPDQSTAPGPAPKANRSRWLRRALYVSLAVNLLVVGTVAGLFLAHDRDHDRYARADRSSGFGMYVRALSREDRAALRAAYSAAQTQGGAGGDVKGRGWRADRRANHADLLAALRAEPFDQEAVAAVFDRHIAAMSAGMARGRSLMLARIEAMTAPERAAFADRLERMMSRADHDGRPPRDQGAAPR